MSYTLDTMLEWGLRPNLLWDKSCQSIDCKPNPQQSKDYTHRKKTNPDASWPQFRKNTQSTHKSVKLWKFLILSGSLDKLPFEYHPRCVVLW